MNKSTNLTNQILTSENGALNPKQWVNKLSTRSFLCEKNVDLEELYKAIIGDDFKTIYAYLISENSAHEDMFEEACTSEINKIYGDTLFYFSKRKQGVFQAEKLANVIEFVTIMNNIRACADGLVLLTEDMKKLYSSISQNGVLNKELDDVLIDEKCNKKAEKILKQIKSDGNFDKLVNNLIISPSLKYDLEIYKDINLGDILLDLKLDEIKNFVPTTKLNTDEKLAVLSKTVSETIQRAKMAKRLIEYINPPAFYMVPRENQHRVESFNTLQVEKLVQDLKNSSKTKEQKDIATKAFGFLEKRLDVSQESVAIDTFEIGNEILPYVLEYTPEKLSTLCSFLKNAKTILPLDASKLPLYMPEITRNCNNDTIDKVFIIENGSKLQYSYIFNPDKYRKEHKIHLKSEKEKKYGIKL